RSGEIGDPIKSLILWGKLAGSCQLRAELRLPGRVKYGTSRGQFSASESEPPHCGVQAFRPANPWSGRALPGRSGEIEDPIKSLILWGKLAGSCQLRAELRLPGRVRRERLWK